MPSSSCCETLFSGEQYEGLNAAFRQYVQPPVPTVPSLFGQLKPASIVSFCIRVPKRAPRKRTKFGKAYVNELYVGKDAEGNTVGYALSVTSGDGYDGNVTLSMGLDATGKVLGIAFTELTETPGMGMLADEPAFKDQFADRQVTQFVHNKGGVTGDNVIDAISGASTTSGAVVNAVNAGLDFFHSVMQGGN